MTLHTNKTDQSVTGVLLAAGTGSRLGALTATVPKVLVTVAGQPLLAYGIAFLRAVQLSRIVVVSGFGDEQVRSYLAAHAPDVAIAYNAEFRMQNCLSFLKALDETTGDLLVADADYIRTHANAAVVHAVSRDVVRLFVSHEPPPDPDCMRVATGEDGRITAMSKTLEDVATHSTGMTFIPASAREALRMAALEAIKKLTPEKARIEDALMFYAKAGGDFRVADVGPHDWLEIDTAPERDEAEAIVHADASRFVIPS